MIDEVLNSIKNAEDKAEEIKRLGEEECLKILQDAEEKASEIDQKAKNDAKLNKIKCLENAEKVASQNYADYISSIKKQAEELKNSLSSEVDDLSAEVFGRIINGTL